MNSLLVNINPEKTPLLPFKTRHIHTHTHSDRLLLAAGPDRLLVKTALPARGLRVRLSRRLGDAVRDLLALEADELAVADLLVEELVQVEPVHLHLLAHAQVHEGRVLEDDQQHAAHHERVRRDGADVGQLEADLDAVAVPCALGDGGSVEGGDGGVGEDACQEGADHAADAVELEDVEALVDAEPLVDILHESADGRGQEPDQRRGPDLHVTRRGRDANEAGDGTFAGTDHTEAAASTDVVHSDPSDDTGRRSSVSVEGSVEGADRAVERRATVEAEPAEPDEDGAQED